MIYVTVRNWVDQMWRGSQWRVLPLPAIIPFLLAAWLNSSTAYLAALIWGVAWSLFVFWRAWIYMRAVSSAADREYDRTGKFRLWREYWATESATAAAKRKQKND